MTLSKKDKVLIFGYFGFWLLLGLAGIFLSVTEIYNQKALVVEGSYVYGTAAIVMGIAHFSGSLAWVGICLYPLVTMKENES